jgi:catechol-2,3-dioxygenase
MVTSRQSEPSPPRLHRVTLLLGVHEVPLALVFYRDIIGLQLLAQDDDRATLAGADGIPAVVLYRTSGRGRPSHRHEHPIARLLLDDGAVNAIRSRLELAAIPFRVEADGAGPELIVRDLDGNEVILETSRPDGTPG